MVERLMILGAVLADRTCTWLGTEFDKRSYFMRRLRERAKLDEFPRLTFGIGATARHRYFPDKLPIGISDRDEDHVFVYLVTSPVPMDFRLFLLRHGELLRSLYRWTIRVLVPAPFGHAARETLATPLPPSSAEVLCSLFRERQRRGQTSSVLANPQLQSSSLGYDAPRFRALFRVWQQQGDAGLCRRLCTNPGVSDPGVRSRACAWGSLTSWLRASETAWIARRLSVAIPARITPRFQTTRRAGSVPVTSLR
jgi:hypothetical protein